MSFSGSPDHRKAFLKNITDVFGEPEFVGDLKTTSDAEKASWYADQVERTLKRPRIKAVVISNQSVYYFFVAFPTNLGKFG